MNSKFCIGEQLNRLPAARQLARGMTAWLSSLQLHCDVIIIGRLYIIGIKGSGRVEIALRGICARIEWPQLC